MPAGSQLSLAGYDKVLRTTQYFAKFYAWYLYRTNTRMSSIQSWTTLNNQLSLTRKILRVRKVLELLLFHSDIYEAVINASHSDKVFQTLQLLRQIGYSGYMFFDVLAVLDAISAKKDSRVALIQAVAYHFWFTGLSASALGAIYTKYLSRDGLSGVDGAEVERVKVVRYATTLRPCFNHITDFIRQTAEDHQQPTLLRSL